LKKVKELNLRGYRQFLMPIDYSNKKPYCWNFLQKTSTISTISGIDTYKLPDDFGAIINPFKFTAPVSINPVQRSLEFFHDLKSTSNTSSYPSYFAIKTGTYDKITGQIYEVVFWPMPNGSYTYYYTYNFVPVAPVNDGDYFIGDELVSEAILERALAVAEIDKNDEKGIHNSEADRLVQQLIGSDKQMGLIRNLGSMNKQVFNLNRTAVVSFENTQIIP
jgi:hypothetical protein